MERAERVESVAVERARVVMVGVLEMVVAAARVVIREGVEREAVEKKAGLR